jgi:hypothetical protein
MMVMPANNAKMFVGYLAGRYPGRLGWIIGPDGWKEPHDWLPYAFDNGAFPVWAKGGDWHEGPFYSLCERALGRKHKPLWIAVPDVVADREATLRSWFLHSSRVAAYGSPLAFVVQDGMTPDDIPPNAKVVFVGGTTDWKWKNLRTWTGNFPRVHVGRVNTYRMLWMAHEAGAESCDGTGWFRGDRKQLEGLISYLEQSTNGRVETEPLFAL